VTVTTMDATEQQQRIDERIMSVVSPLGGVVGRVGTIPNPPGCPDYTVCVADLGDLRPVVPGFSLAPASTRGQMDGAGTGVDAASAAKLAVVEALERYSNCVYDDRQLRWATRDELGRDAIDLDTVPRCSDTELSDPLCPLRPADNAMPIRWVRGISLTERVGRWVPAVMAFLNIPPQSAGEQFVFQISTGCAAHVDPAAAVLNAICEVVERDAVSLTWLQRLALPMIEGAGTIGAPAGAGVRTYLFDATTDIGVPTVYGIDVADGSFGTAVMCAADLDPERAIAKVLREAASGRVALSMAPPVGTRVDDFTTVSEGASYMAQAERRGAFDFLLGSSHKRAVAEMKSLATGTAEGDLAAAVDLLARRGMEVVVVDLTTDEAARAGLWVVRAIIPALQPLSFTHRARFLGHPRLYDAPVRMGYRSWLEPELNPWPQPFA
jgi:ribosomal protein S12 methylthiotransferase accessory factor